MTTKSDVPCPVCAGAGRWHKNGGTPCFDGCEATTTCMYCKGTGKVPPQKKEGGFG